MGHRTETFLVTVDNTISPSYYTTNLKGGRDCTFFRTLLWVFLKGTKPVLNCFSGPFREIPRILSKSSNQLMHDSFECSQVIMGCFVFLAPLTLSHTEVFPKGHCSAISQPTWPPSTGGLGVQMLSFVSVIWNHKLRSNFSPGSWWYFGTQSAI